MISGASPLLSVACMSLKSMIAYGFPGKLFSLKPSLHGVRLVNLGASTSKMKKALIFVGQRNQEILKFPDFWAH